MAPLPDMLWPKLLRRALKTVLSPINPGEMIAGPRVVNDASASRVSLFNSQVGKKKQKVQRYPAANHGRTVASL